MARESKSDDAKINIDAFISVDRKNQEKSSVQGREEIRINFQGYSINTRRKKALFDTVVIRSDVFERSQINICYFNLMEINFKSQ